MVVQVDTIGAGCGGVGTDGDLLVRVVDLAAEFGDPAGEQVQGEDKGQLLVTVADALNPLAPLRSQS